MRRSLSLLALFFLSLALSTPSAAAPVPLAPGSSRPPGTGPWPLTTDHYFPSHPGPWPLAPGPYSDRLAYLYNTDVLLAGAWQRWLAGSGLDVDVLSLAEAGRADLGGYARILIGADTGSLGDWGDDALVARILASGARVVGLGEGGYAFLGRAGAGIGYPNGGHAAYRAVRLPCFVPALSGPRPVTLGRAGAVLYAGDVAVVEINAPSPAADLFPLAQSATSPAYWPVIRQGDRLALWGFAGGPDAMTADGEAAFLNLLDYMAQALRVPSRLAVDTLVLSACGRMLDIGYDRSEVLQMTGALQTLVHTSPAATGMTAVHADMLAAPDAVKVAYAQWDEQESSIVATNALVAAVDAWIESLKAEKYPYLKNVILAGSHEVIPMQARPADNADENYWGLPQMTGYLPDIYHAGDAGYYLTDTPYGDLSTFPDGWGAQSVLSPEIAVGRLVETPAQIRALVDAYIAAEATLGRVSMLSAGSDDFMDGARAAAGYMSGSVDSSLIQSGYTSGQLPPKMSAAPDVVFLAGHGDYNWITTRKWDQGFQSGPIGTQGDMSEVADLPNAVVVSDGCHNGVNFGNRLYAAPGDSPDYRDFPEEFAARRAGVYLASTGYTWISLSGAVDTPAWALYSEKIASLYVKHLLHDGVTTTGRAWLAAVDEYLADAGPGAMSDGGNRRALATFTLYGFPTYRWPRLVRVPDLMPSYPIRYWWREEVLSQDPRLLRIRYTLRLPSVASSLDAAAIPGLNDLGGGAEPLRPVLSLRPVLPPGSSVQSLAVDTAAGRSHVLRGGIQVPAMGNRDHSYPAGWLSPDFFPAQLVTAAGGQREPIRLQINPVQRRTGAAARALNSDGTLVDGETRVWDQLVFTVDYALGASVDADQDGLPGYWEDAYGLSDADAAGDNGPDGDPDGDGVRNAVELQRRTNPANADTDHDGATDGWELANGLDPLNPAERRYLVHLPAVLRRAR